MFGEGVGDSSKSVACILGAGFSAAAGVPLARNLFASSPVISLTDAAAERFSTVTRCFEEWSRDNPNRHAEEFMGLLYDRYLKNNTKMWPWAVEYICARIASPGTPLASSNTNPRYSNRINRPSRVQAHMAFWNSLFNEFSNICVVTTNYDILVERAIRHKRMKRPFSFGCFYGGLDRPQILKGASQPFSRWSYDKSIEMTGSIPIYKLHGSLNWSIQDKKIKAYQDLRPVYRYAGDAAILPPVPDKSIPCWLAPIWKEAGESLRLASIWIICGYSVPSYDVSVQSLLKQSANGEVKQILVLSHDAKNVCNRLQDLVPKSNLECLPGLPDCLEDFPSRLRHLKVER